MQITIPPNSEEWLRQQAEQSGFANVQDYVLAIVLPQQMPTQKNSSRSFYDAAVEVGLIGGGSELATDLSTNRDHMAGFGE